MIRKFHEIRRHEEGQALILAAISMLILALCALATVNLSFAVSQKMRLQNAADAGAYSVAAHQARAMNYFAYSNRTMVVHYASQMNMIAIMSYLIFTIPVFNGLAQGLAAVPGLQFFAIILRIAAVMLVIYYLAFQLLVMFLMPLIDAFNLFLWASQNGVSDGMLSRTQAESLSEVKSYNSDYSVMHLSPISQSDAWRRTVDVRSFPDPRGPNTNEERLDRLIMAEIINSARNPWTAFGLTRFQPVPPIPRHFGMRIGSLFELGKYARTEYGLLNNGATRSLFGFGVPTSEEIFSVDQFRMVLNFRVIRIQFAVESWVSANRAFGEAEFGNRDGSRYFATRCSLGGLFDSLCEMLFDMIFAPMNAAVEQYVAEVRSITLPVNFHYGLLPYARFRAVASGEQFFNQPPVALVTTLPTNALRNMGRPFMGDFGVQLGTLHSGGSPLMQPYGGSRPSTRGYRRSVDFRPAATPPAGLPEGLHAASAALTYYHRPGDWREPPNLFNPLWGAKLIPIMDHPLAREHPALQPLVSQGGQRLVVH